MPKLKRVRFLSLIGMQIVNFVQSRSGMREKQLAHDILDRQRGKSSPACSADIVDDKVLEWHALRSSSSRIKPSSRALALLKPLMGLLTAGRGEKEIAASEAGKALK